MSLAHRPFDIPAAWEAATLERDTSWVVRLDDTQRAEVLAALDYFKRDADARGLTAQWLHGNMTPVPATFPLPALHAALSQAQADLEDKYGLILIRGIPVEGLPLKDIHLMYAGLASHIGTLRPQTMFGEYVQDIRDTGQAALKERRGSKHNRALSYHTDPCDVISLLCIRPAQQGGVGLFVSSLAIHNALLASHPEHVRTLYEDFTNTYQDYLFVKTGFNEALIPGHKTYAMPTFTVEQGRFACKYSRFYIDQAQELPEVARLTSAQIAALDVWEEALRDERWRLEIEYEPGDAVFSNNFICLHARTAFSDVQAAPGKGRHLLRVWLTTPNSRPLSDRYRHYFFRETASGVPRGGIPLPPIVYA